MRKLWALGAKDLTLLFRDRAGLILMLAAPLALTVGLGFVTGAFAGGGESGLRDLPLALVNQDQGELGGSLVDLFTDPELADLLEPTVLDDPALARQQVDQDQLAAAVVIPAGFSAGVLPDPTTGRTAPPAAIEVYRNPSRPTSSGVVAAIVEGYLSQLKAGQVAAQTSVDQMVETSRMGLEEIPQEAPALGQRLALNPAALALIRVQSELPAMQDRPTVNPLAYIAPAMALLFLMYTVGMGARSLLRERDQGTLARLLTSPTGRSTVLAGKLFGTFLTGVAQLSILTAATTVLFRLDWGQPLGLAAVILASSLGATGWGALLASLARTPAQVGSVGAALMLTFGVLGGSFFSVEAMPPLLQGLGRITPNYWGLLGFTRLASGGAWSQLALPLAALVVMGAVLFALAAALFRRGGLGQG